MTIDINTLGLVVANGAVNDCGHTAAPAQGQRWGACVSCIVEEIEAVILDRFREVERERDTYESGWNAATDAIAGLRRERDEAKASEEDAWATLRKTEVLLDSANRAIREK